LLARSPRDAPAKNGIGTLVVDDPGQPNAPFHLVDDRVAEVRKSQRPQV